MAEVVGGISGLTRKYLPVPQAADVGKYLKVDTNGNPVYYAETPGGVVTAEGAAVANDAGAAVGATTALKLANLTENASTAQEGVSEFATAAEIVTGTDDTRAVNVKQLKDSLVLDGMWLTKRTKMPDGATAVYAYNSAWNTYGFSTYQGTISHPSADIIRCTYASGSFLNLASPAMSNIDYKTVVLRARANRAATVNYLKDGSTIVKPLSLTTEWQIFVIILPASCNVAKFSYVSATSGDWLEINWLWIGDYSMLDGSMLLEGARVANELAVTQGVGVAASGTITSNGTNVSVGDTVTINGKTYTFVDVAATPANEGEIQISSVDANTTMLRLQYAIDRYRPDLYDGVIYKIAAPHPSVYATRSTNTVSLFAGTASGTGATQTLTPAPGILGNQITLAKSVAALTLSGSTLTGGKDAVGDKVHTQLQTMPATTSKYGAALLAADGGTTAGTVVQANDSRLATAPAAWTPVPKFGGVADDGTFAITANNSIKIGKFVHIEAVLTWTVKGSKTGTFTLTGAPVAGILPGTFKVIGSAYVSTGGLSIPSALQVVFDGGSFVLISQGATGSSTITDANLTETTQIRIVGDYIAA